MSWEKSLVGIFGVLGIVFSVNAQADQLKVFGLDVSMESKEIVRELKKRGLSCQQDMDTMSCKKDDVVERSEEEMVLVYWADNQSTPKLIEIRCGLVRACGFSLWDSAEFLVKDVPGLVSVEATTMDFSGPFDGVQGFCGEGSANEEVCVVGNPAGTLVGQLLSTYAVIIRKKILGELPSFR